MQDREKKKYETSRHDKKGDEILRTSRILPRLSFFKGAFATLTLMIHF